MGISAGILCYYLWPPYVIYAVLSLNTLKKRIQKATKYDQLHYASKEFQKTKKHLFWLFILCVILQMGSGAIVNFSAEWSITWAPCAVLGFLLPIMVCADGDKHIKQREQELRGSTNNSTKNHLLEQIVIDFEEEEKKRYSITFLPKHEMIGEFEEKGKMTNSLIKIYLSANSIFVSGAGYSPVNGEYVRHGSYCGEPMWKHKSTCCCCKRLEIWFNNFDGKYPGVGQWRIGNDCSYIYVCNIWKHESNNGPVHSGEWTLQEAKHGSKNSSGVAPYPVVSIAQPKSNVKMNYVCIKSIHASVREYTESYGMKVGDVIESIRIDGPDGYEHEVVKLDDKTISILENERPITLTCYSGDPISAIVSIEHAGRFNESFLWAGENTAGLTRNRVGGYWRITPFDGDICTITYIDNSGEHYLYADDKLEGCGKRRYVRLSKDGRPPKDDPRAYWQIVLHSDGDKCMITHAGTFKGEYLYNKSNGMGGNLRTWKGLLHGDELVEDQALWRIINVPIQKRSQGIVEVEGTEHCLCPLSQNENIVVALNLNRA